MDTIRVIYHREPDGWWAESPDIDGWSAAGGTYDEVRALAVEGVPFVLGSAEAVVEHFVQDTHAIRLAG